jgi:hypothetical protein
MKKQLKSTRFISFLPALGRCRRRFPVGSLLGPRRGLVKAAGGERCPAGGQGQLRRAAEIKEQGLAGYAGALRQKIPESGIEADDPGGFLVGVRIAAGSPAAYGIKAYQIGFGFMMGAKLRQGACRRDDVAPGEAVARVQGFKRLGGIAKKHPALNGLVVVDATGVRGAEKKTALAVRAGPYLDEFVRRRADPAGHVVGDVFPPAKREQVLRGKDATDEEGQVVDVQGRTAKATARAAAATGGGGGRRWHMENCMGKNRIFGKGATRTVWWK